MYEYGKHLHEEGAVGDYLKGKVSRAWDRSVGEKFKQINIKVDKMLAGFSSSFVKEKAGIDIANNSCFRMFLLEFP